MNNVSTQLTVADKPVLVQTRVRASIKEKAAERAELLGLPLSSVMTLLLADFAHRGLIPSVTISDGYEDEIPNSATLDAFAELDNGHGAAFDSPEKLFNHLGI